MVEYFPRIRERDVCPTNEKGCLTVLSYLQNFIDKEVNHLIRNYNDYYNGLLFAEENKETPSSIASNLIEVRDEFKLVENKFKKGVTTEINDYEQALLRDKAPKSVLDEFKGIKNLADVIESKLVQISASINKEMKHLQYVK